MKAKEKLKEIGKSKRGQAAGSREVARQKRLDAILGAARCAFFEEGYSGASMDGIAARARVSKPTIYKFFPGKEQLFAAIIEELTESISGPILNPRMEEQDVGAALLDYARNYALIVLSDDMLSLHRLVIGEAQRFPDLGILYYEAGYHAAERTFEVYLQSFVQRGDLVIDNYEQAANDFWVFLLSYVHEYHVCMPSRRMTEAEVDRYLERGLRIFLELYKAG